MNITINHTSTNFSNQRTSKKYIVWHDTGVRDQSDEGNAAYFKTVYREASAHYFIDEDSITEVVDPNYVAWHCGDGNGLYGITNQNSIGIELCVEANGLFKPETIANAVWLGKKLMKDFGISANNNVRHYDASRKNCPQFLNTDGKWTKWYEFKAQLSGTVSTPTTPAPTISALSGGLSVGSKATVQSFATHYQTGQPIADWVKGKAYTILQTKAVNQSNSSRAYLLSDINSWVLEQDLTTSVTSAPAPSPAQTSGWVAEDGTFTTDRAINVRQGATTNAGIVAVYGSGESVRYDSYYNDGHYVWIHYKSYSGSDRYMVCRENGTAWGSFS